MRLGLVVVSLLVAAMPAFADDGGKAEDAAAPASVPARGNKPKDNIFFRVDRNFLVGLGVVGAAQYDQGEPKIVATANISGLVRLNDRFSLGGVGLAVRSTEDPFGYFFESDNFNEFGLAVPLATYRSRHKLTRVAQVGVEIQRINFQKYLYYFAVGVGWNARKPAAAAAR